MPQRSRLEARKANLYQVTGVWIYITRTIEMFEAPIPPGFLEHKLESLCPVCGQGKLQKRFDCGWTLGYRCPKCGWIACVRQSKEVKGVIEHQLSAGCPRCQEPNILISRHKVEDAWDAVEFQCRFCGWTGVSGDQGGPSYSEFRASLPILSRPSMKSKSM